MSNSLSEKHTFISNDTIGFYLLFIYIFNGVIHFF